MRYRKAEVAGELAKRMETVSCRALWQTPAQEAGKVSRTACGTSSRHRALEVGELHRGTGTFEVQKAKVPEGGSDGVIRESLDELT